jgi:hypothetical protein
MGTSGWAVSMERTMTAPGENALLRDDWNVGSCSKADVLCFSD